MVPPHKEIPNIELCVCFFCICIYAPHGFHSPTEARRGFWSHGTGVRYDWASMWLLRIKPRSSGGATSAHNHWAISLASIVLWLMMAVWSGDDNVMLAWCMNHLRSRKGALNVCAICFFRAYRHSAPVLLSSSANGVPWIAAEPATFGEIHRTSTLPTSWVQCLCVCSLYCECRCVHATLCEGQRINFGNCFCFSTVGSRAQTWVFQACKASVFSTQPTALTFSYHWWSFWTGVLR